MSRHRRPVFDRRVLRAHDGQLRSSRVTGPPDVTLTGGGRTRPSSRASAPQGGGLSTARQSSAGIPPPVRRPRRSRVGHCHPPLPVDAVLGQKDGATPRPVVMPDEDVSRVVAVVHGAAPAIRRVRPSVREGSRGPRRRRILVRLWSVTVDGWSVWVREHPDRNGHTGTQSEPAFLQVSGWILRFRRSGPVGGGRVGLQAGYMPPKLV